MKTKITKRNERKAMIKTIIGAFLLPTIFLTPIGIILILRGSDDYINA